MAGEAAVIGRPVAVGLAQWVEDFLAVVAQVAVAAHGATLVAAEDLVVFVNSDLVNSIQNLNTALARLSPGDDVQLTVRRGDDLVSVTMRIPRKSESDGKSPASAP